MSEPCCPVCGGEVERTTGEATRTMCPAFYRSAEDLYTVRVTVPLHACVACEWVAEVFTGSDTMPRRIL